MLSLIVASALATGVDPRAVVVLAAARRAYGGAAVDRIGSYELVEAVNHPSGTATETLLCDPASGRESASWEDSASGPGGWGFDGGQAWYTDSTGDSWPARSAADISAAMQRSYLDSFEFLSSNPRLAKIDYLGESRTSAHVSDELRVSLPQARELDLFFDRATHLLAESDATSIGSILFDPTYYSDYRSVHGVMFAFHRATSSNMLLLSNDVTVVVKSVHFNPSVADRIKFARSTPSDSAFARQESSTVTRIDLSSGLPIIYAKINGEGPFRFLVDTADSDKISLHTAVALKLHKADGSIVTRAAYPQLYSHMPIYSSGNDIEIGGATIHGQPFAVEKSLDSDEFDGILGFQVLRRFVVTFDEPHQTVTLTSPSAWHPDPDARQVPFVFDYMTPELIASINGSPGLFVIHSGEEYTVTAFDLWLYHTSILTSETFLNMRGDDGTIDHFLGSYFGYPVRVDNLRVDDITIADPIAFFADSNSSAQFNIAGAIGNGLLGRYVVTFDYQHSLMELLPARATYLEPFERSGIEFVGASHYYPLVLDGSPAGAALPRGGAFTIISIDGLSIEPQNHAKLISLLDSALGSVITLRVQTTGGQIRTLTFKLKDWVPRLSEINSLHY